MSGTAEDLAWYVAYGSNLAAARFACYVAGGCPEGSRRTYTGCRDTTDPRDAVPLELPGSLVFAGRSTVWSGGMAFYEPAGSGTVPARAYLLTSEQVSDVVAQETRFPVGTDLGISRLVGESAATVREDGYDSVLRLRDIDGLPAVTLSARRPLAPEAPSERYLRWICTGLRETHGWSAERIAGYLASCRGVEGRWPVEALVQLAWDDPQTLRR